MILKTSSNKLNPAVNFFKTSLNKQKGFVLLSLIISLLICPGILLKNISDNTNNIAKDGTYEIQYHFSTFVPWLFIFSLFVLFLLLILNFSFLYSKKSSDVFHSLPMTRNELLITRFSASFIGAAIPLTASFLGFFIITALPFVKGVALITVVKAYLLSLLQLLMCGSFILIFIVSAGAIFDMIISLAAVNIGFPVIALIISNWLSNLAEGVEMSEKIIYCTSPILYSANSLATFSSYYEPSPYDNGASMPNLYAENEITLLSVIAIFVFAALFCFVAALLFKKRKSETAGEAYSFKFMPVIITILISIGGGLILSAIFDGTTPNTVGYWTFFCIGALLASVAAGAIMTRGFKKVEYSLIKGSVAVVIMVALCVVTLFCGNSSKVYIPNETKIKYIITNDASYGNEIIIDQNFSEVINLHKIIVGVIEKPGDRGEQYMVNSNFGMGLRRFELTYVLNSGRKVRRVYYLNRELYNEPLLKLMQSENYINVEKEKFTSVKDNLLSGDFSDTDKIYGNITVTKEELLKIGELYIKELKKAGTSVFDEDTVNINLFSKKSDDNVRFHIPKSFTETIDYVNTLNIVLEEVQK